MNDDPNAVADSLVVTEDEQGWRNVLDNDTDLDGDTLTVTTLSPGAAHGTVSCLEGGLCTYTPEADYKGTDSFQYSISDGDGGSDTATVSVTVTPENIAPVADDETLSTAEDASNSVNVLVGDSDADGDALSVTTLAPAAAHRTVSCSAAGSCTYTPEADWSGDDSFEYTVSDGRGKTDTGLVSVTVTAVNNAPVAGDDVLTADEDAQGQVDVLTDNTDVEGDALSVTGSTNGAHGAASCDAGGTCTYTPAADYSGADTFTYTVSDGNGGTDIGSVSVTVTALNDAPVADDDALTTTVDTAGEVDVLTGDVDVDGDELAVEAASDPEHGSVTCDPAGLCTYTPRPRLPRRRQLHVHGRRRRGDRRGARLRHRRGAERRPQLRERQTLEDHARAGAAPVPHRQALRSVGCQRRSAGLRHHRREAGREGEGHRRQRRQGARCQARLREACRDRAQGRARPEGQRPRLPHRL